jgi:hypothetical protein
MEIIKVDKAIIAIIYREKDWIKGLNFITPEDLYIQVGSWYYEKGKKLDSHIHKVNKRSADRTHEMTYVKKGSMKVFLYDENKKFIKELVLHQGDLAVFANGGHGYEILEDDTQIVEAKNGPFTNVETDKEKF